MDVEVRIRDAYDTKPVALTRWPLLDLDRLIQELKAWYVVAGGDPTNDLSGQFVVNNAEAYFEICVGDDD